MLLFCVYYGRKFNWSSYIFKGMLLCFPKLKQSEGVGYCCQAFPPPIPETIPETRPELDQPQDHLSTPPRQQTSDPIAPVFEHGQSSDPNIASFSRAHETDDEPFTSTNVEDEPLGGSFHASPPRSTQAPPAVIPNIPTEFLTRSGDFAPAHSTSPSRDPLKRKGVPTIYSTGLSDEYVKSLTAEQLHAEYEKLGWLSADLKSSRYSRRDSKRAWVLFSDKDSEDEAPILWSAFAGWEVISTPLGEINALYMMDQSTKHFTTLREILHMVDRQDLLKLYGLVVKYYENLSCSLMYLILSSEAHGKILKHKLNIARMLWANDMTTCRARLDTSYRINLSAATKLVSCLILGTHPSMIRVLATIKILDLTNFRIILRVSHNSSTVVRSVEEMLNLRNSNEDPPIDLYDLKGSDEGDNEIDSLTKEPSDTLLMGDEVISTAPKRENDELIKSSVDDIVLIPRESEVTSDSNLECDMLVNTHFPTTDVREEKFDINSPLGKQVVDFLVF
ncbi:hypothetical protein Tco_0751098 [Tanacetum coccineum]|uniref:Uncharacterized protein n=1 Tax=Tanacetum coccineum TaxID=301880 RepID=A0ABQ4Z3W4_9ASTR